MRLAATLCLSLLAMTCAHADDAPSKPSTAGPGVRVLAPLEIPGLQRQRAIRVYTPPGYATSNKRYPVLYMHDGQNLFDDATSYVGEWKVDETLDALARAGRLELIVVGIDHGNDKRMTELNAWANPYMGAGEGREYVDFIVKTVKPMIDRGYRTLPGRAHTAVMGSSMGGLISHYAITQYPKVFSKAGVFSPAYWTAPQSYGYAADRKLPKDARVYLLMGEKEGGSMVPDVEHMAAVLRASGHPASNTVLRIVPGAEHNERFWAGEFAQAVEWMFAQPARSHGN